SRRAGSVTGVLGVDTCPTLRTRGNRTPSRHRHPDSVGDEPGTVRRCGTRRGRRGGKTVGTPGPTPPSPPPGFSDEGSTTNGTVSDTSQPSNSGSSGPGDVTGSPQTPSRSSA